MIEIDKGILKIELDDDFEELINLKWWIKINKNKYYAVHSIRIGKITRKILMHRFIMCVLDEPSIEIDHIDGNGLNNQRVNLRHATRSENMANTFKRLDNSSGFKGVDFRRGKWRTRIQGEHIGDFENAVDAALAYDVVAKQRFGKYARTNF